MALATEIIGLRSLGFSLAQVEGVLSGVSDGLEVALAAHQELNATYTRSALGWSV